MATDDRAAILVLSAELLARLLYLPEGAQIDAAEAPADRPGTLRLRVRGFGPPAPPHGGLLPELRGVCTTRTNEDGLTVTLERIDWSGAGFNSTPGARRSA